MSRGFILSACLIAAMIIFVACNNREAMIHRHFYQFIGTDVGTKVIIIDEDWSNGVDAIGIAEQSTSSGPMTFFYYLDTEQNIWHQFYKRRIYVPK